MQLPFSPDQFRAIFAEYNLAVWPAQVPLLALGVVLALAAWLNPSRSRRWVAAGLALLWAWMGAVYHLTFFARINPAARLFGFVFLAQAGLFLVWAFRPSPAPAQKRHAAESWIAGLMLLYALAIYSMVGWALGHRYPVLPTFGLPCPTTIATLGLLLFVGPPRWWLLIVPIGWAVVGTSAAITLGFGEDFGLAAAALLTVSLLIYRGHLAPARRTARADGRIGGWAAN